jgi:hypothetical protein
LRRGHGSASADFVTGPDVGQQLRPESLAHLAKKGQRRQWRRRLAVLDGRGMPASKRSKIFETAQASLQAGRLEGIIDVPKSGRWGKWKYGRRGKTQWCQPYVKPKDPGTAPQKQARDAFGGPAQVWGKKLTQEQRDAWNGVAKQEWSKPRLAQKGPLHGQQVFTGRSSVLLKVGKELRLWPTARPVFKPNPAAALSITHGSNGMRITVQVSGPVTEDIMVLGQAPCSAGRKKWRRGAYLCLLPAVEGGECDITAKYVERFGEPTPGTKVFIRVQQQRDGWKDFEKDLSEVVPVKAETEAGEIAGRGARVALNGLNGSTQSPKLQEVNELHGVSDVREGWAVRRRGEGRGVRCTREWFRIAAAAISSHYRWGTQGEGHIANGKWQIEGVAGRRSRRHWRELWHGS